MASQKHAGGVFALVFGLVLGTAAQAAPTIVDVDCSKKKAGVQEAIDKSTAAELIVQISGTCEENVVIRRNDVTLRGTNPATDGLKGMGPDIGGDHAVVMVHGVTRIRLESMRIIDGSRLGLNVQSSYSVFMVDVEMTGNVRTGINLSDSLVDATRVNISGGLRGIGVFESGLAFCHDCVISASGTALLVVGGRGFADAGSTLNGGFAALLASSNAVAGAIDSTLTSPSYAIWADNAGQVEALRSSLDGSLFAERRSGLVVRQSTQVSNPIGETVFETSSSIDIRQSSTVLGPVYAVAFSTLMLDGSSSITGDLTCERGGNAHCDDPNDVSGTTNGCDRCVKP